VARRKPAVGPPGGTALPMHNITANGATLAPMRSPKFPSRLPPSARAVLAENLRAGALVLVAAQASRMLGLPAEQVPVLWPATACMLAWCLRRGPAGLPGAMLAIAGWAGFGGAGLAVAVAAGLATGLPPWLTARTLRVLRRWRPPLTRLRELARTLALIAGLQSPMAAAIVAIGARGGA
jgi:hypothetical protein